MFIRYRKGIYFKTVLTPFGNAGISFTELVKRMYLTDGENVIGYETGPSYMNKIGLTTQIPACTYLATKKFAYNNIEEARIMTIMECIEAYVNQVENRIPIFTDDIYSFAIKYNPNTDKQEQ